jgi:catechol 2,3-dioxygenase-like lactoylglutathione lyase family enzyme
MRPDQAGLRRLIDASRMTTADLLLKVLDKCMTTRASARRPAMPDNTPLTIGVDHIGLAVKNLETARRFFCECLGWKVVGENQNYPASFVSDGNAIVTLWQVEDPEKCVPFDRLRNIGLHHLALKVVDRSALEALHARVAVWPGTVIEFALERSGKGPKVHFMVREPGGTRIEFACVSPAAG